MGGCAARTRPLNALPSGSAKERAARKGPARFDHGGPGYRAGSDPLLDATQLLRIMQCAEALHRRQEHLLVMQIDRGRSPWMTTSTESTVKGDES